ncbi:Hypothetical protein R9X50_00372800 [Acrodontium crateriforme]|uniref:Protein FAF1 n=1 Tax=Acrodontium crateriforme TaxID=150365 RepID=A0AAQ3M3Z2_9PEZI|nr:Hypothetical protein R9X50_00372800 [Acrodontium crateriforme]
MAVSLGKRKRPEPKKVVAKKTAKAEKSESDSDDDIRARFQRAFEARFKPLETPKVPVRQDASGDESDEAEVQADSDWSGISDEEDAVEVVEHGPGIELDREEQKREMKAFMSSKPPSSKESISNIFKAKSKPTEDEAGESDNLKHDLALQRLLKESHLLDPTTFGTAQSTNEPSGKSRLKALNLRLEDLGAKKGIMDQAKMPLSHLRGIKAKAISRESKRRKEAAENGIILERAKGTMKGKPERKRERGVDGPGVGKFRGGTLSLSKKDVRAIEGPKKSGFGKGKRR